MLESDKTQQGGNQSRYIILPFTMLNNCCSGSSKFDEFDIVDKNLFARFHEKFLILQFSFELKDIRFTKHQRVSRFHGNDVQRFNVNNIR